MTDKDKEFEEWVAGAVMPPFDPSSKSDQRDTKLLRFGWDAHAEMVAPELDRLRKEADLVKPLIEAAESNPWAGVLSFIKKDPDAWLLSFRGADRYELEHFPEYYMGDKEAGTGDWSRSGTMEEILDALTNREGEK